MPQGRGSSEQGASNSPHGLPGPPHGSQGVSHVPHVGSQGVPHVSHVGSQVPHGAPHFSRGNDVQAGLGPEGFIGAFPGGDPRQHHSRQRRPRRSGVDVTGGRRGGFVAGRSSQFSGADRGAPSGEGAPGGDATV
jgi:hypothetical protein